MLKTYLVVADAFGQRYISLLSEHPDHDELRDTLHFIIHDALHAVEGERLLWTLVSAHSSDEARAANLTDGHWYAIYPDPSPLRVA